MKDYCYCDSPIGRMLLVGMNGVLEELHFPKATEQIEIPVDWQKNEAVLGEFVRQLQQYFAGDRQEFDLPITPR
ncbi:MAG: cysteine methyltransferase, partial [Proteobacteria bacterium]|nr:cysteine methyltransferase [Pseudomonadota bacterium]